MTFMASVPLNSDSPGIFPAQNQGNMSVLQTIISADHQFNLTPMMGDNSGYHNLVHLTQQAPSGVLSSYGRLYVKMSAGRVHLFYMDSAGGEYQISPSMPMRAAVNFSVDPSTFAVTINSNYNIASVVRTFKGKYTITFTTAMPNAFYMPSICVSQASGGFPAAPYGFYVGTPTTTSIVVAFQASNGAFDPGFATITFNSAT